MTRILTAVAASALMIGASAGTASAQDWRALADQDLTAAHAALRDNHPAAVVEGAAGDPFRAWLDAGLADAKAKTAQVNSGDSHAYLMRYYARGFQDPNIIIRPTYEAPQPWFATGWPGFTTAWQNNRYVVSYVKPGLRGMPPVGAVLKSCAEVPVDEMVTRRLAGWEGDLTTEAGRVRSAPYLTWNRNNPFGGGTPANCTFTVGRRDRDFRLTNQVGDLAGQEAAYRATIFTPSATPLAVETVNGRPWIRVNTLGDNPGWETLYAAVEAQAEAIRGPQGFVLDLRGANGATLNATARGYGLANRIWTPEFTVSRQPPSGEITYRASAANRQWFADTLGRMQGDPAFAQQNAAVVADTAAIVAAFDTAIAAGQTSFSLPGRAPAADTGAANPVTGPVIVLVDSGCSGGCLDTLDLLTRLPNVRVAGKTTAADSIFIEPTVQRLPSNYSDLSYGHKAWTTRERGSQPFTPEAGLMFTGNIADEAAVQTWVGTLFGG